MAILINGLVKICLGLIYCFVAAFLKVLLVGF